MFQNLTGMHQISQTYQNLLAVYVRGMIKRLPMWLWKKIVFKMYSVRPQCSFLPLVEDTALVKPSYQRSLQKTLAIHRELAQRTLVETT